MDDCFGVRTFRCTYVLLHGRFGMRRCLPTQFSAVQHNFGDTEYHDIVQAHKTDERENTQDKDSGPVLCVLFLFFDRFMSLQNMSYTKCQLVRQVTLKQNTILV